MKAITNIALMAVLCRCGLDMATPATAQEHRSLVELRTHGFGELDKPCFVIKPESGCVMRTALHEHTIWPSEAFSISRNDKGVLFRIESGTKAGIPAGHGIFVVIWARPRSKTAQGRLELGVKTRQGSKSHRYIPMLSPRIEPGRWARLAGWHYAEQAEEISFYLQVPEKGEYQFDRVKIWVSPKSLPPDNRPAIRVDGDTLKAGDETVLLNGVNLYAYADDEKEETIHPMVSADEDDYANMAMRKFNVVRLNLWHKIFRQPGGWAWLDLHRMWARRHGLRLILDLHAPPGGYQGPEYRGDFYRNRKRQAETIAFWREASTRFSGDPTIAAFDLVNEPCPRKDAEWWDFVERAIPDIRQAGWNRPLVVEKSFAGDAAFRKLDDDGIIYDCHFYEPWDFCSGKTGEYGKPGGIGYEPHTVLNEEWLKRTLKDEIADFVSKNRVPANIGEYGIKPTVWGKGGDRWLSDFCALAEEYQFNRQYWCWHYFDWALSDGGWHRYAPYRPNHDIMDIIQPSKAFILSPVPP